MAFPNSPRVLYGTNPLEQVICQLRFPPILRITSDSAADFQDAIRDRYPLYSEEEGVPELPLPESLAAALKLGQPGPTPAKRFTSPDEHWTVALAQHFVALTTGRYERWEGFRDRLRHAVDALERIYDPAFYTRIGLRYRDVIRRSDLDLPDVPWSQLLAPNVLSELGSQLADAVQEVNHIGLIDLGENAGKVRVRHGLDKDSKTGEEVYCIDADFFTTQRTIRDDVNHRLDHFKTQAACFFRWCITQRLHDAMAPRPIE